MADTVAELLFKVRGDTDQARSDFKSFKNDVTSGIGEVETSAGSLASALPAIGVAFTAIATTAVAATTAIASALFDAAKAAGEFGSTIYDASVKTGLSARQLSALKVAADQSGSSFEKITDSVQKFSVLIGQAAAGSEKAQKTLKQFGIDPVNAVNDLTGALEKAFTAISSLESPSERAAAAQALFKDRTGDILPIIDSANGNLKAFTAEMERLGLTIDDKTAESADRFGDTLDTVNAQLDAIKIQIGSGLLPVLADLFGDLSNYLARNKDEWAFWGAFIGQLLKQGSSNLVSFGSTANNVFSNFISYLKESTNGVVDLIGWLKQLGKLSPISPFFSPLGALLNTADDVRGRIGEAGAVLGGGGVNRVPSNIPRVGGRGGGRSPIDTSERDALKAQRDAERQAAEDERNRVNELKNTYQDLTEYFTAEAAKRLAVAKEYATANNKTEEDIAKYAEFLAEQVLQYKKSKLEEYLKALGAGADGYAEAQQRLTILELEIEKVRAENAVKQQKRDEAAEERAEKAHDQAIKRFNERIEKMKEIDEMNERAAQREAAEAERKAAEKFQKDREQTIGSGGTISAIGQLQDAFIGERNEAALAGLSAITAGFEGLAQAVGQVVSAYVLYGSAGTSVRKVTAQILAGIAQQAAVKAVYELAEGFAMLALAFFGFQPQAGPSAAAHFTAAAIYGGIAGIAAIAGRAVAGDSFKKESSGAYGSAGSGAGSGSNRNVAGQGQVYSGYGNGVSVIEQGRNAPNGSAGQVSLVIKDKTDWFAQMFQVELNKNGKVRQLILDTAAAA